VQGHDQQQHVYWAMVSSSTCGRAEVSNRGRTASSLLAGLQRAAHTPHGLLPSTMNSAAQNVADIPYVMADQRTKWKIYSICELCSAIVTVHRIQSANAYVHVGRPAPVCTPQQRPTALNETPRLVLTDARARAQVTRPLSARASIGHQGSSWRRTMEEEEAMEAAQAEAALEAGIVPPGVQVMGPDGAKWVF